MSSYRNKIGIILIGLVLLGFVILLTVDEEPEPEKQEPAQAPEVVYAPSAMPPISENPATGLVVDKDTVLDQDLLFNDKKYELLAAVTQDNVTLDCRGHKIAGNANYGINIHEVKGVKVKNCAIDGPFQGINIWSVDDVLIMNTSLNVRMNGMHVIDTKGVILDNVTMHPDLEPGKGFAVEIKRTKNAIVRKCSMRGFDQGILLYGTTEFTVKDNLIQNITETGIGTFMIVKEMTTGNGRIENNHIQKALMGMEIHSGSHNIHIANNRVENCRIPLRMDDEHKTSRYTPVTDIVLEGNIMKDNIDPPDIVIKDKESITWKR